MTEERITSLEKKIKAYNPSLEDEATRYVLLPTASLTNLDKNVFWRHDYNNACVEHTLLRCGCPSVRELGLLNEVASVNSNINWTGSMGCSWKVYLPDASKPLNEIARRQEKISVFDLAKELDMVKKTVLIKDSANRPVESHYWLPSENGDKTVEEACPLTTPTKKCEMPKCNLKRIFGCDFKVKVATPKEVSEEVLIPLINRSLGPLPDDLWKEIKEITKMKEFDIKEYANSLKGEYGNRTRNYSV